MAIIVGLFLPPRHCADNFFSRFFYAAPRPLCGKREDAVFSPRQFQLLFFWRNGALVPENLFSSDIMP